MSALVEDLLLLARLDAGRPLESAPVDLTRLAIDATSDARVAGPDHRWQLELPDGPVLARGDDQRLHQVLANLLSNARTHTPAGTTVTVALGPAAGSGTAQLSVTDDGPGIPAELQPDVFERFVRGDGSRSRQAGNSAPLPTTTRSASQSGRAHNATHASKMESKAFRRSPSAPTNPASGRSSDRPSARLDAARCAASTNAKRTGSLP